MTASSPDLDPIQLAAQAAIILSRTHRFAYARIAPDLTIRQISANFHTLIPQPALDIIGFPICDLMDELMGLEDILTAVLHNELPLFRLENINREHQDGSIDYLNFQINRLASPPPDAGLILLVEDNTPLGRIQQSVVQDRNHLRLVQQQLADANQELQRLNQLKSLFLSMAAHDLRSPLTVVQLHAELLAEQLPSPQVRNSIDVIIGQVQRLNHLITDLLDLEKLEQDKLDIEAQSCDLNTIVNDVVKTMDIYIRTQKRNITLKTSQSPIHIWADSQRIWQILYNLISNAVKYTKRNGRIHISTAHIGDKALLRVADNGRGISPDQLEQLFAPFYRTKEAKESNISGTGLGLHITKALVDAHNGRITVTSQPDQGTTFTIYFPLHTNFDQK